jgi:hypothetical protein
MKTILRDGVLVEMTDAEFAATEVTDPVAEAAAARAQKIATDITAAQLAGAMFLAGKITATEARSFGRSGEIPPSIMAGIDAALTAAGMTADQKTLSLILLESATTYSRNHPVTPIVGAAMSMDANALDDLWVAAHGIG